jgi:phosphopantetheinyl transferase
MPFSIPGDKTGILWRYEIPGLACLVQQFSTSTTPNLYLHTSSAQRRQRTLQTLMSLDVEAAKHLQYDPQGKPSTDSAYLSASHKAAITAVCLSDVGRVGIDVETAGARHPDFAASLDIDQTYRTLHDNDPAKYVPGYWSCLEAVWKCSGQGSINQITLINVENMRFRGSDNRIYSVLQKYLNAKSMFVTLARQV